MATPFSVTERFTRNTGFNVVAYLTDFTNFIENDRQNIVGYYSGRKKKPNVNSFKELNRLLNEATKLNAALRQNVTRFQSAEDWDLLEQLENVRVTLFTTDQASKWLRSVITRNNFNPNPEVEYSLQQNQTLEGVARDVVNTLDPNNDYVDIALRNDLNEEKYTNDGGVLLKINLQQSGSGVRINTVVDNLLGERMYGLDLPQRLEFDSSESDFVVLSFKDTVIQAIEILAGLRNNDNPEYPDDGISQSTVVGTNRNALFFPLLFRQLYTTFQKDDTLTSFSIINLEVRDDVLYMEYEVQTKYGELIQNSIKI